MGLHSLDFISNVANITTKMSKRYNTTLIIATCGALAMYKNICTSAYSTCFKLFANL